MTVCYSIALSWLLLAMLVVACTVRRSLEDDDYGGSSGAGQPGDGKTGSSSDKGCAPGGQPCVAYSDCCSGVCDNQLCTGCAGAGDSCADKNGCCPGLTCYEGTQICEKTCAHDGYECSLASDCCSNVCANGICAKGQPQPKDCNGASCKACALSDCAKEACFVELGACNANNDCVLIMDCAVPCLDAECVQVCGAKYPNGVADAVTLQGCLCGGSVCASDCLDILCSAG